MQNTNLFAFYNVENLFPPDTNNSIVKSGMYSWNEKRFQNKISKIGQVLHWITKENEENPIFIGLAEVSNDQVLDNLLLKINYKNYQYVHYNSLDERGIDTALIYDESKMKLVNSQAITVIFDNENLDTENLDTTRDVLECQFISLNHQENWWIYVLHLPSKREKNINKIKREEILNHLKKRILEVKKEDSNAEIVIMGDFNSNPDEDLIIDFCNHPNLELENSFLELYKNQKYSSFFKNKGMLFDQIIFSKSRNYKIENSQIFNPHNLKVKSKKLNYLPFRTYVGTRYLGGYSDHFPVLIKLNYKSI